MSQQLSVIDLNSSNNAMALPAHLANVPAVVGKIPTGDSRNRIALGGREFHIIKGGVEEGTLETKYGDFIIVGAVPSISRMFYAEKYVSGVAVAPSCYSSNGITPAEDVKNKQSAKCNTCPQNEKGSSINGDEKGRACSFFRRIAVILVGDPEYTIYQMDIKAMSLWGDGNAQKGQYGFNEYAKKLQAHNMDAGHVVTRMTFDPGETVPKLLFQAVTYISEEQLARVVEMVESNVIAPVLEISMTTVDSSGEVRADSPSEEPPAQPLQPPSRPRPAPAAPVRAAPPVVRRASPPPVVEATGVEATGVEDDTPEAPAKINYANRNASTARAAPTRPTTTIRPTVARQPVAAAQSDVDELLAQLD